MGQLIVQNFVSADGFAADANNEFTFYELLDGGTAEFDRSQLKWLETIDTMVLGADTYRMFVEYWPTPASKDEIIAPSLNSLHRVVFSRQLTQAPWGDMAEAAIESGNPIEAISRIKAENGGDIVLWGSLTLAQTFLAAGVVDSVRLVVMPIAIGAGRGVFPPGQDPNLLSLQSATAYDQGLVELVYGIRARNE
ncbi:dihydrofolate reductase family protein [Arthrobacter sp. MSA 4-2]|uniref:dihydrofolate reductase family protein n=1 Tax=Arthrobacter sp. MSA 4-2 TaxID=2794349 RepID=UPI0018E77AEC|nr:dihydrofolate reductase family protein [Arthrobacter sp. MSA 4-2]MBJ2121099.1 dihydrofolate reductase family protein [Arthrobacter sp. MSA 4-2]